MHDIVRNGNCQKYKERKKNLIGSHGIDNDVAEASLCFFFFLLFHNACADILFTEKVTTPCTKKELQKFKYFPYQLKFMRKPDTTKNNW